MPSTRRSRTIAVPAGDLWTVVRDPHHLPRWWPRVERVESVEGEAFTELLRTPKGRAVRADFLLTDLDEPGMKLVWAQQLEGTPFARLMKRAETELQLSSVDGGSATEVTIVLHQSLSGFFPRLGFYMVRRATIATLEEALDGLERIAG